MNILRLNSLYWRSLWGCRHPQKTHTPHWQLHNFWVLMQQQQLGPNYSTSTVMSFTPMALGSKLMPLTNSHTPESRLLPLIVVVNYPVWDHFECFHCDGCNVLKLQLLHSMAARPWVENTRKASLYYLFCESIPKTAEIWTKWELLILSVFVSQPSGMKKAVLWRWWKALLLLPFPSPSSLPLSQIIKAVKVRFTESLDTWQVEKTEEGSGKLMCSGTVSKQDVVYFMCLKLIKL